MSKNINKSFLKGSLALPILYSITLSADACSAERNIKSKESSIDQPNIIVVLCDDLGYADVGFNGAKDIKTPNIDRIASEGIKFTSAYTTYSVSSPSRAGLMTGRYGQRFGYERNVQYRPRQEHAGLDLNELTMAQSLGKVGYTSCAIGKWHLGSHEKMHPCKRGFDEFFGFLGGGHKYFPESYVYDSYKVNNEPDSYRTFLLNNYKNYKSTKYLTDELSDYAVDFVNRHKEEPFFMYLAYNAPHTPQEVTQEYLDLYPNIDNPKRKKYAAMISAVDRGVGRLLDCLDKNGISENTIVYFLSDNGGPEHVNASDNGLLREGKGSAYEGGFRVPFAMRWPKVLAQGKVYNRPISSMDIFATASAITNSPTNPNRPLDGVNILPYITGNKKGDPHSAIYLRKFDQGRWTVRRGDYKMLYFSKDKPRRELYNLSNDISESNDISKINPKLIKELEQLRVEWNSELIDPVFDGIRSSPRNKNKKKYNKNK